MRRTMPWGNRTAPLGSWLLLWAPALAAYSVTTAYPPVEVSIPPGLSDISANIIEE